MTLLTNSANRLDQTEVTAFFGDSAERRPMLPNKNTMGGWGKYIKYETAVEQIASCGGKDILDLGCNMGHVAYLHKQLYPELDQRITGVDLSTSALLRAQTEDLPNASFRIADGTKLPFADNSFDMVVSIEVLEHVVGQDKFLAEIYRILRPGGRLFLTTPNGHCWPSLWSHYLYKGLRWLKGNPERHKDHFLNQKKLLRLMREVGFAEISAETYFLPRPFLTLRGWILTPPIPPRWGLAYQQLWVNRWGLRDRALPRFLSNRLYHTLAVTTQK